MPQKIYILLMFNYIMAYIIPGTGWHHIGVMSKSELRKGFKKSLVKRFLSVLETPANYLSGLREKLYDISVRGYEEIPKELNPGGDFMPVGFLREGESEENCFSKLRKILTQGAANCIISFVVTPGPAYHLSPVTEGAQYERDNSIKKVVWARWILANERSFSYGN